jgi:hypothetical protein
MAVTKSHPRIKVEVQVDGVAVQEYEDDDEQETVNTVTKYVEAVSNTDFVIGIHITPPWPQQSILFKIYLDGKYVRGNFIRQDTFKGTASKHTIEGSNSTKNGQWYQQNFCFSDLNIGMFRSNKIWT